MGVSGSGGGASIGVVVVGEVEEAVEVGVVGEVETVVASGSGDHGTEEVGIRMLWAAVSANLPWNFRESWYDVLSSNP